MTHTDACKTDETVFEGSFGEEAYASEYQISVTRDDITAKDGTVNTWHYADLTIGSRWGSHQTVSFNGIGQDDKQTALSNMYALAFSLNQAILKLEAL